ncbi:MAG: HAD hydrolase-like protein [Verrucomicrobiales bacterium]
MRHSLALFDFDATLADSLPWFQQATRRLAGRFGFTPIDGEDVEAFRHRDAAHILAEVNLPLWKVPRVVAALRRLMAEEIDGIRLFPGVAECCQSAVRHGWRLGVVSSNSEDNVRRVLGPDLAVNFSVFECGASLLGKAAKLRRAVRRAGSSLDQAIYIGDELRDLDAAMEAGLAFGAVTWGWNDRATFTARHPAALFESVAELTDFLR